MTLARCLAADLCVRTLNGFGRRFGVGAIADLDEVVDQMPSRHGSVDLTLRDALGEHVAHFVLLDPPAAPPVVVDED